MLIDISKITLDNLEKYEKNIIKDVWFVAKNLKLKEKIQKYVVLDVVQQIVVGEKGKRKEMCLKKEPFDIVGHPECSHNWVHYAGKQCMWDRESGFPYKQRADSRNIAYMYICTMRQGEYWSSNKDQNIPHYVVKEVKQ